MQVPKQESLNPFGFRSTLNPSHTLSFFLYLFLYSFTMATTLHRRPIKVVTDSEDDQSDIRQRSDFHITSRRVSTVLEEKHEDKKKRQTYQGLTHTIPIHTLSKASVLSKEAPPENYNGFIRLGSKYKTTFTAMSKLKLSISVGIGC